jgi:hypothetical protein
MARLRSINVGLPRDVAWEEKSMYSTHLESAGKVQATPCVRQETLSPVIELDTHRLSRRSMKM